MDAGHEQDEGEGKDGSGEDEPVLEHVRVSGMEQGGVERRELTDAQVGEEAPTRLSVRPVLIDRLRACRHLLNDSARCRNRGRVL